MIIQCEQCQTKFRLDDAKIKGRGVKVRCSKCRHVFLVRNEEPRPETAFGELLGQYGDKAPESRPVADASAAPEGLAEAAAGGVPPEQEAPGSPGDAEFSFSPSTVPAAEEPLPSSSVQADEFDFSFDAADTEATQGTTATPAALVESEPAAGVGESFDFPPVAPPAEDQTAVEDFTIDFGELSFPQESAAGRASAPAEADQGRDTFNLDFDDVAGEARPLGGRLPSATDLGLDEEMFSSSSSHAAKAGGEGLGALDFSDLDLGELPSPTMAAKGAVSTPGETAGGDEPAAATQPSTPSSPAQVLAAEEDAELPPLTISSRRKGASFFPAAVTVAAIIFVVILAGVGFFVVSGPETMKKMGLGFIASLTGSEAQEEGKISLGKVTAEFVTNMQAGELFVIRGETINNYSKPRASIQVKATLLGANGQPILSKPAYCGNSLTKEQLAMLSLAKIEEVMNNQFGDSLSNLGVQPGKSIPFVVVFANVPKEAVDFSVAVAGSTVAAK